MTEKNKRTGAGDEDWAVLPFNEAEDDARWAKLTRKTEKLEKEVARADSEVFGPLLTENSLDEITHLGKLPDEDPF